MENVIMDNMDNHEFVMETYKPFDEYLKKHKYDPKTNTIEIDGKREPIKTKMSNKEMNRLNKFLRENKYDPKTETILTDVDSGTSDAKKRVKFTMNTFSQETKGAHYKPDNKEIHMPIKNISSKPTSSNTTFKHEEGHFNDWTRTSEIIAGNKLIKKCEKQLENDNLSDTERARLKNEIIKTNQRLQKIRKQQSEIHDIMDKANKFNEDQDDAGLIKNKVGNYNADHDRLSSENYADYYASKHNKYGDPSKNTAGNLFNHYGYHKMNNNKDTYINPTDEPIHAFYDIFRSKFKEPIKAMQQSGVLDIFDISINDMNEYLKKFKELSENIGKYEFSKHKIKNSVEQEFPQYEEIENLRNKTKINRINKNEEIKLDSLENELNTFVKEHPSYKQNLDNIRESKSIIDKLEKEFYREHNITPDKIKKAKKTINDYLRHGYIGTMSRQKFVNSINESCLIMDNDEFFMEASKNPDIKARKRTVKNLRRLGVDRAHEVDNRKLIDKLERQIADLKKKYDNKEISYDDYNKHRKYIESQMRKLENGIDINITDSQGYTFRTTLRSDDKHADSYETDSNIINIPTSRMRSNQFDAAFSHEAGHAEQDKRYGFNNINKSDYDYTDKKDDYPIKCAKLFLQKNKDKMNTHDTQWTELHADFLSCKKIGFGKMMKLIASFKRDKKDIDNDIENCIKNNEETCKKLENDYLKFNDVNNKEHTLTQADIDKCIELYNQEYEKLIHYRDTLQKRYDALHHKKFQLGMEDAYKKKLDKIFHRVSDKMNELRKQKDTLSKEFNHNGVNIQKAMEYNRKMKSHVYQYTHELNNLKVESTTNDYRIRFMEDMKHIHEGHPERCSMKYPPMTPADKKYMQAGYAGMMPDNRQVNSYKVPRPEPLKIIEKPKKPDKPNKATVVMPNGKIETWADDYFEFTVFNVSDHKTIVDEMYLSNIITESEYIQLQERIQILTERSE